MKRREKSVRISFSDIAPSVREVGNGEHLTFDPDAANVGD